MQLTAIYTSRFLVERWKNLRNKIQQSIHQNIRGNWLSSLLGVKTIKSSFYEHWQQFIAFFIYMWICKNLMPNWLTHRYIQAHTKKLYWSYSWKNLDSILREFFQPPYFIFSKLIAQNNTQRRVSYVVRRCYCVFLIPHFFEF